MGSLELYHVPFLCGEQLARATCQSLFHLAHLFNVLFPQAIRTMYAFVRSQSLFFLSPFRGQPALLNQQKMENDHRKILIDKSVRMCQTCIRIQSDDCDNVLLYFIITQRLCI